ncbi:MAG: hypothetical protein H0W40_02005 [Methylibium sp.]|uniref:mechanosensitive ion channel family protein n=1 Tax=Methylibium sp. TaxID=2067992 RepID=UPI00184A11BE|nr:hypothetical protein [Methylibium sp.]MBA3596141.1 hypothetical protein [Methylibium sp.]
MENVDMMLEPARAFLIQIGAFLPRLGLALLILLAGFLVAKAARFAIEKGLRAMNFHIVTKRSGMDGFLQLSGSEFDTTRLFGALVYWVVILAALIIAFNGLGLEYVTELLGRVMLFVPRVIVALLVLAFGAYFARFVGNAVVTYCRGIGVRDADLLGRLARYAILTFVVMIALDEIDIGGAFLVQTYLILLAGLVLALALAFGLGGREWAAARLERWWPTTKGDDPS